MSENYKRENTDEITCPYCDYEFGDSWENIPRNEDGEIDWKEECPECEKEFNVSFDARNIDDGYTSSKLECKDSEHNFEIGKEVRFNKYWDNDEHITPFYKYAKCKECGEYEFIPVKEDGTDFTPEETQAFNKEIAIKNWAKRRKKTHYPLEGEKEGLIKSEIQFNEKPTVTLKLKEEAGNCKIWISTVKWFLSKGFKTHPLPDYLRDNTVRLKRNWLEVEVSLHNFAIEVFFYQNEIQGWRKPGGGRYDDTYKIVTDQMRAVFRAHMYSTVKYFESLGFQYSPELTDTQQLLTNLKVEKFEDHKDPENHYNLKELTDRDGKSMKSGDVKYYYYRGILKRGEIWWNSGNQWYALSNGILDHCSHWKFFDADSSTPTKKPLDKDQQIDRLWGELTKAERAHEYDRCKSIYKLLESYKLYRVWSIKHGCWWGSNNGGYTSDINQAGVYTHENIMKNQSYYNDGVNSEVRQIQ